MFRVIKKEILNQSVKLLEIEAPCAAKKAEPGQFVILRVNETAERIPLTIADYDREKGSITVIFQEAGKTTKLLGAVKNGENILDFSGPLGMAAEFGEIKKAVIVGGGLGTAMAFPQAKKLHNMGVEVHFISGFRNRELIILEEEIKNVSNLSIVMTDDGSNENKGFVTDALDRLLKEHEYDIVIAIGPLVMMKAVSSLTKIKGIKTVVSMNPIMIDGTGMCGGCRVTVGGETKFACVDGPDFDGHEVDFDEAIRRQGMYKTEERESVERHTCNLERGG